MREQFDISNLYGKHSEAREKAGFNEGEQVECDRLGQGIITRVDSPFSVFVEFDSGEKFLMATNQVRPLKGKAKIVRVDFKKEASA